jgi:hypothetical protein
MAVVFTFLIIEANSLILVKAAQTSSNLWSSFFIDMSTKLFVITGGNDLIQYSVNTLATSLNVFTMTIALTLDMPLSASEVSSRRF